MYSVEDITGWDLGYPDLFAINSNDQVAGALAIPNGDYALYHGLIALNPGQVEVFSGPGPANFTQLNAINDLGVAVGYWRENDPPWRPHSFMYANGEIVELDPLLGSSISIASDINDEGVIVGGGDFGPPPGDEQSLHAFVHDPSSPEPASDLNLLAGKAHGHAAAVNESNQVVGWMNDGGLSQPFLYDAGAINFLADQGSVADINEKGHVAGTRSGTGPFFWSEGVFVDIPCDGYARAINNDDQVVGSAANPQPSKFLNFPFFYDADPSLSPVPGQPESPSDSVPVPFPPQVFDLTDRVQLPRGEQLIQAYDINDSGHIAAAVLGDYAADGVILIPPRKPHLDYSRELAQIVAIQLFGKGQDGGGLALVGGHPVPIDPLGPLSPRQKDLLLEHVRERVERSVANTADRARVLSEVEALLGGFAPPH